MSLCKCVIWDLDNTVWDGVCLEGRVSPRPEIRESITTLHQRGILHSIASRGEEKIAWRTLQEYQLAEFFLIPKINWLPKSTNILEIVRELNVSLDTVAFVDDDPFEREQVSFMLPGVRIIAAENAGGLPARADFNPGIVTEEARMRSRLYEVEKERQTAENSYSNREEFLLSCGMQLTVRTLEHRDIPRVMEMMTRTHQLNTTGLLLHGTELNLILEGSVSGCTVYVAELRDKFGCCGIIGTALAETCETVWTLQLFALSCRIMGRGIERAFLSFLIETSLQSGYRQIAALYRETERNRTMRALYQMTGFLPQSRTKNGSTVFVFQHDTAPGIPHWVSII